MLRFSVQAAQYIFTNMHDQAWLILLAGEEEVQYVVVSLPSDLDPVAFGPGSIVTVEVTSHKQYVARYFFCISWSSCASCIPTIPPP